MTSSATPRRRRPGRKALLALGAIGFAWLGAYAVGAMHLSTPVDLVLSSWPVTDELVAAAPAPGPDEVVVLLHGLARGPRSMARLERALAARGYEVWNEGYDSRAESGAEAAARIGARLAERVAARTPPPRKLHAVAHSLGGLVLRRIDADAKTWRFARAVCLGSPQRGAVMAEALHSAWLYRMALGSRASFDLRPGAEFVRGLPARPRCELGSIVGATGTPWGRSRIIPGDDDGRVALRETEIEGERARSILPLGHTALCTDERVISGVLRFLASGSFEERAPQ
jgi:pimeloyl-ACP methyl ester carboxylesterase